MADTPNKVAQIAWLPTFCSLKFLLSAMAVAQIAVLLLVFGGGSDNALPFWQRAGIASLFVQWTVATIVALLCALQRGLSNLRPKVALVVIGTAALGVVASASIIAYQLDSNLQLRLLPASTTLTGFLWTNLWVAIVILMAAGRYFYVLQQWRRSVEARAEARVQALQARIRPHFLFNSMNLIASLISRHPEKAEEAVEDLSDLFRGALRNATDTVSLQDEIELVRRYLNIESLRLGERLTIAIADQPTPNIRVPALILQPLVENAVYHGIGQLAEGGTVSLDITTSDKTCTITIRNPTPVAPKPGGGSHIALENIRERLALQFAGQARLHTEHHNQEFVALVELPLPAQVKHDT